MLMPSFTIFHRLIHIFFFTRLCKRWYVMIPTKGSTQQFLQQEHENLVPFIVGQYPKYLQINSITTADIRYVHVRFKYVHISGQSKAARIPGLQDSPLNWGEILQVVPTDRYAASYAPQIGFTTRVFIAILEYWIQFESYQSILISRPLNHPCLLKRA